MSKKYKHKPFYRDEHSALRASNVKLISKNEALSKETKTLQIALRMLTSTDKETLIEAIEYIERGKTVDWWSGPVIIPSSPISNTFVGSAITSVILDGSVTAKVKV